MTDFFIQSLIWIFAIYGFIEIIKVLIMNLSKINMKNTGIYIIIAVKNQEEKIEGFLRSFLFRVMYGKEEYKDSIMLVDLNSTDNSKQILEKFKKDYQLELLEWKDCKTKLED
ncbi:MAG: glycosyltransferase [Oscillospiraceae bacterium]|nr:glycosyltransferase [Oscillospiraceae bacterium]